MSAAQPCTYPVPNTGQPPAAATSPAATSSAATALAPGAQRHGLAAQLLLAAMAGCALVAALAARLVLPDQFLLDDAHLQRAMEVGAGERTGESFQEVGALYRTLGLDGEPSLAALLGVGVFVVCLVAAVGWERARDLSPVGLAAIAASLLLAVAYLGQYSKELITAGIAALVLFAPRHRMGDAMIIAGCIAYGLTLRPYWLIVAAGYPVWLFLLGRIRRTRWFLLVPPVLYALLLPAFALAFGGGLQFQRTWSNAERGAEMDQIASLIVSPLPDAIGPMGVLAALLMLVLMIVPVPLLATLSAYHVASALLIMGIWVIVLVPVFRGRLAGAADPSLPRASLVAVRAAALLLSLLMVQALFEPDYGSYLKHLTPLLPLALALLPSSFTPARPALPTGGVR